MWECLPEIVLEDIFLLLNKKDRYRASRVCKRWNEIFFSPSLWHNFIVKDNMFLYNRLHPLHGYVTEISKYQIQTCLSKIGAFIRTLDVKPTNDFYKVFEFLFVLNLYIEYYMDIGYPMECLENFKFTFGCESRDFTGTNVIGTGGKLLDELNKLLFNLKELKSLSLNDLLLNNQDAIGFLENAVKTSDKTLKTLELINITKDRYPIYFVTMFSSLSRLIISPQNLSSDIVLLLARHPSMEELVIVQNKHTPISEPVSHHTWLEVREIRPDFKVRLEVRGITTAEVMVQERAPVHAVMYDSPYARVTAEEVIVLSDMYHRHLCQYGHLQLPRKHGARSFQDRADTHFVLLIRECPNIHTLVIRERVSTATLLVIASEAKKLRNFFVRREGVLKRFDWPKLSHWSDKYYSWLKHTSTSYDRTEKEISKLLNTQWHMMSDYRFMRLRI